MKPIEIQSRLIEANVRRRHNFLLAQKHHVLLKERGAVEQMTRDRESQDSRSAHRTTIKRESGLTTIGGESIASTAEGPSLSQLIQTSGHQVTNYPHRCRGRFPCDASIYPRSTNVSLPLLLPISALRGICGAKKVEVSCILYLAQRSS